MIQFIVQKASKELLRGASGSVDAGHTDFLKTFKKGLDALIRGTIKRFMSNINTL